MTIAPLTEELVHEIFIGRTDAVGISSSGRYQSVRTERGQFQQVINDHLKGKQRVAIYPLLDGNVIRFSVIDFDSHRRENEYREITHYVCFRIYEKFRHDGIESYAEVSKSGFGNYHLWIFFEEAIEAAYARRVLNGFVRHELDSIPFGEQDTRPDFEIFPKQDRLNGSIGNCINLPSFPPRCKEWTNHLH